MLGSFLNCTPKPCVFCRPSAPRHRLTLVIDGHAPTLRAHSMRRVDGHAVSADRARGWT
jgi:hypothetical protein